MPGKTLLGNVLPMNKYSRKLYEAINQRAKSYYTLTCVPESAERGPDDPPHHIVAAEDGSHQKKERIMFESVTPKASQSSNIVIFEVEMKKENGGFVRISRTFQNFSDLHENQKSEYPDDTPNIPDELDVTTSASKILELSYSLHEFLN